MCEESKVALIPRAELAIILGCPIGHPSRCLFSRRRNRPLETTFMKPFSLGTPFAPWASGHELLGRQVLQLLERISIHLRPSLGSSDDCVASFWNGFSTRMEMVHDSSDRQKGFKVVFSTSLFF